MPDFGGIDPDVADEHILTPADDVHADRVAVDHVGDDCQFGFERWLEDAGSWCDDDADDEIAAGQGGGERGQKRHKRAPHAGTSLARRA